MYVSESTYEDTTAPQDPEGALAYLRGVWGDFEALSGKIIDLQHRAALARLHYTAAGNTTQADASLKVIQELAKLQQIHHKIVTWAEGVADTLGLGVVQIPLGIAGVTVAALLVIWVFRKYAAQERALDLLEAGTLTPEQFEQLDILDPPGIGADVAGIASGIGKWALIILAALIILEVVKGRGGLRPNPPLVLLGNPPGPMSGDVYFLAYEHEADGEAYLHKFGGGVEMEALEDGSVLLRHPEHEIWRDF